MRRAMISCSFLLVAACSQAPAAEQAAEALPQPAAAPARTVAVELFTSQGCSSCPPADAVLERIGREPNIVVLSRPVTYWDRLGWRDTLARPANDQLQYGYVRRLGGDNHYTPQAVVQGQAELIGSHEPVLRQRIAEARRRDGPSIDVAARMISVSGAGVGPAEVRVLALQSHADVAIGGGENSNRRVRYTNVVLDERRVGVWSGGEARFEVPAETLRVAGADRFAVIVQEPDSGPIIAVRYL